MAEPEKMTNVFEQIANADPKVLEAIFEGLRPWALAANGDLTKPAATMPAPEPKKS